MTGEGNDAATSIGVIVRRLRQQVVMGGDGDGGTGGASHLFVSAAAAAAAGPAWSSSERRKEGRREDGGSMGSSVSKLSKEDMDYLLSTTNYSKKQIKQWYKGFMKDCPTGELSRRKFLSIYRNLFPDGTAGAFYEHVFRTLDEDGSGKIDFREFLQAINVTQAGKPEDKLDLAFRLYDIDRNGVIEEHEMVEIIRAIYLMTETDVLNIGDAPVVRTKQIFDKMDSNHDGVLSKEEFIKGCLEDDTLYTLLACNQEEES